MLVSNDEVVLLLDVGSLQFKRVPEVDELLTSSKMEKSSGVGLDKSK